MKNKYVEFEIENIGFFKSNLSFDALDSINKEVVNFTHKTEFFNLENEKTSTFPIENSTLEEMLLEHLFEN
jgi:hypothetical protein